MSAQTKRWLTFAIVALALAGRPAQAVLEIEITQGVEGALPIAVVPFEWRGSAAEPPAQIAEIVADDLRRSGLFNVLAADELPQRPAKAAAVNFGTWRGEGVESLVIGAISAQPGDAYEVRFQLFDAVRGKQMIGYTIPGQSNNLRQVAHKISDLVFEALTGRRGAFSTRVAYVSTQTNEAGERRYVLQVADSDGHNANTIYAARRPLMSPAWSPDGGRLAYVSFENRRPEIFIQDVAGGSRIKLSGRAGLNSAPAWSPNGQRVAVTLSKDGNPDVYVMDLASRQLRRLTRDLGIDTEPAWTPDGDSLIFTSDRSGQPQLYRVSAAGGGRPQRLTFEGEYNAGADVSPDGEQIAMVHNDGEGFRIAVQDLSTGAMRVLTDGSLDEGPSFAPNGSMILYATEHQGRGVLSAVSEDGRVHQRLRLQEGQVREPVWSPFPES